MSGPYDKEASFLPVRPVGDLQDSSSSTDAKRLSPTGLAHFFEADDAALAQPSFQSLKPASRASKSPIVARRVINRTLRPSTMTEAGGRTRLRPLSIDNCY